ncbi:MAG: hypothetical protein HFACDABA_00318 [Anaerolineales bacterium]|nr:hypothetical protein [Anaerolineales bacterium]
MKHSLVLLLSALLLAACGTTARPLPASPTAALPPSATPEACQPAPAQPTPIAAIGSRFAPVTAADWVAGAPDAPVTMIIYNDFQCVECNDQILTDLLANHPDDLRLAYRHYPQPALYDKALLAAQAAEAAGAQNKFWEMHNLLFQKQGEWVTLKPDEFIEWLGTQAETIGLERARFESDLTSAAIVATVERAMEAGKTAGIPVLPLILINGQIYTAPKDPFAFDQVIRLTALGARQFSACPAMTIHKNRQYLASIETTQGTITLELFADKAPFTVNSFIFLARQGWYDGVTFQGIAPGLATGDPSGTGIGGPGYVFHNEIDPALHFNQPGVVAMLNFGPDTNGSQFFITLAPQPNLDGMYTIFGRVLSGLDVLAEISPRDPDGGDSPAQGDLILTITIEER